MGERWHIRLSNKAEKQYEKLKKNGRTKPSITDLVDFLIIEMEISGPERIAWPHYGKLSKDTYHCHLKRGKPTFVACWRVVSTNRKEIEVFYVGTHEAAPY